MVQNALNMQKNRIYCPVARPVKVEKHRQLAERMAKCKSMAECKEIMEEMKKLEDEIDEASKPLALNSLEPHVAEMNMAAQYSDELCSTYYPDGTLKTACRAFYICLCSHGSATWECKTLTLNKSWLRKSDEPWAKKQRWYCPCCDAAYNTTWGQLVEMTTRRGLFYLLAEIPKDWDDIRAMWVEAQHPNARTPEALWEAIKNVHPATTPLLRLAQKSELGWRASHAKMTPEEGVYKILAGDQLKKLPKWTWDHLVHFGKSK